MDAQHGRYVPSGFVMAHLVNPIVQRLGGTLVLTVLGPRVRPAAHGAARPPVRRGRCSVSRGWRRRDAVGAEPAGRRPRAAPLPWHHDAIPGRRDRGVGARSDRRGVPGEAGSDRRWVLPRAPGTGRSPGLQGRASDLSVPNPSSVRMLIPRPVARPSVANRRGCCSNRSREQFIGRHDRTGPRRCNPEPCSRPQDRPRRSGAMVRRMGGVRSAPWWGSESVFLGRGARVDRRPTRHGPGGFVSGWDAGPRREKVKNLGHRGPRSQPSVLTAHRSWFLRGFPSEPQVAPDSVTRWPGSLSPG